MRNTRGIPSWALAIAVSAAASATLLAQRQARPVTFADVLARAAAYVAEYERELAVVVAEERYTQTAVISLRENAPARSLSVNERRQDRTLRSEYALVAVPGGWIGFRDVLEVDGRMIHDRANRLESLLSSSTGDVLAQARKIAAEGSRFNIGSVERTLNHPTLALAFLRADRQARSTFSRGGTSTIRGTRTFIVRFVEHGRPALINDGKTGNVAASGRFWIDQDTGRVLQTELDVAIEHTTGRIVVEYAPRPPLPVWVPISMTERYDNQPIERIEGRATYDNFRVFSVRAKFKY